MGVAPAAPTAPRHRAPHSRASSSDATAAEETTAGSTVSEHARGYGTVVTSQANFLRVVVTREMSWGRRLTSARCSSPAMDRASQAGKTDDVAKPQERLGDEGPCTSSSRGQGAAQEDGSSVPVGDAVDVLGIDWVGPEGDRDGSPTCAGGAGGPTGGQRRPRAARVCPGTPPAELPAHQGLREHGGHGGSVHAGAQQVRPTEEQKADWAARLE